MSELDLRDFPKDERLDSNKYSTDAYEISSKDQQLSFGNDVIGEGMGFGAPLAVGWKHVHP